MAGKDIIMATQEGLKRLNVIHKVLDKSVTQIEAAGILDLTDRHIRRLAARIAEEGDKGIVHKLRGKTAHNCTLDKVKIKTLSLCKSTYEGFSSTLAPEKLFERDKIKVGRELLRTWFIEEHIAYQSRKARSHRNWRERKANYGQMVQADGSHHDWFEGRGPWCVLMWQIDDATSKVSAEFHDYEGTLPFMESFKSYIEVKGIPLSVYIDRHSTYKSNKKLSIEDELENREPLTEVGRALEELGVEVIFAHSAQAKGRVERLFRTFQRVVIEEYVNGSMQIWHKDTALKFKTISVRPEKEPAKAPQVFRPRRIYTPQAYDHPWVAAGRTHYQQYLQREKVAPKELPNY